MKYTEATGLDAGDFQPRDRLSQGTPTILADLVKQVSKAKLSLYRRQRTHTQAFKLAGVESSIGIANPDGKKVKVFQEFPRDYRLSLLLNDLTR